MFSAGFYFRNGIRIFSGRSVVKRLTCLVLISAILCSCRGVGRVIRQGAGEGAARGLGRKVGEAVGEATGQLVGEAIVNSFGQQGVPQDVSKQQALWQIASAINQSAPITVDQETVLVNVAAQPDGLAYNYVLVNYSSSEVDPNLFLESMYLAAVNQTCSNPDLQIFWQNDVSLYHSYSGNDRRFIARFSISPSDCGY